MILKPADKGVRLAHYIPILEWGRTYIRQNMSNDLIAVLIVTIMLTPQSLAYAMLAGLAPEVGLYASIVLILLYSVFGTSRTLAVGPVAVVSLMTAAVITDVTTTLDVGYAAAALSLAGLSGITLLIMGALRLGFDRQLFVISCDLWFYHRIGYLDRVEPTQACVGC